MQPNKWSQLRILFLEFVLLLITAGCTEESSSRNRHLLIAYLLTARSFPDPVASSFDSLSDLDESLWFFEVKDSSRVSFDSFNKVEGNSSMCLTVQQDDWVANGTRAELVLKDSDPLFQEAWYRWSFRVPSSYTDESAATWQIMGQWHDQPEDGNWENYPGHSPMVAVNYGLHEGSPAIAIHYGIGDRQYLGPYYINRNSWYTITFHVYWSLFGTGFAEAYVSDGTALTKLTSPTTGADILFGANMYNRAPAYLKLGQYRNPEIAATNSVCFDAFRRSPASLLP